MNLDRISNPRNSILMRMFLNMGLTEHTGHGIPTIINKYGHDVFDIESNYIRCTIPFDAEVISKTKNKNVGLNKTEKKVIRYLLDDESYSAEDIAKKVVLQRALLKEVSVLCKMKD